MEERKQKILISGASIAGLTLAYWLEQYGYKVTVIEIAKAPRKGGSPIDIKGEAVEVVRKMGIYGAIEQQKVNTEKVCFVNHEDQVISSMDPSTLDDNLGEDIEIQREFLVDILYHQVKDQVDFIFDNTITKIEDGKDCVNVHFNRGESRSFHLVIGADGLHSNVRSLVFGRESAFIKYYGMYAGVVDIEPSKKRKNSCVLYNSKGKMAGLYNFNDKANAILVFHSKEPLDYNYKNIEQQKDILCDVFSNEKWRVTKILQKFKSSDTLYFDAVSQIRMRGWSKNRVALVGDAAYCASFLTGRGASLATMGAFTLAGAIREAGEDYHIAFKKYEKMLRPMVKKAQSSINMGAFILVPKTKMSIWLRNCFLRTIIPLVSFIRK